jgi:hypothetical protein
MVIRTATRLQTLARLPGPFYLACLGAVVLGLAWRQLARRRSPAPRPIQPTDLDAVLANLPHIVRTGVTAECADGIVVLRGRVSEVQQWTALRRAFTAHPGVVDIVDLVTLGGSSPLPMPLSNGEPASA